jgi:hypothetical protein
MLLSFLSTDLATEAVSSEAMTRGHRPCRSLSSTASLTQRAMEAIAPFTERGWSDHFSPANHEAASMAQAFPEPGW